MCGICGYAGTGPDNASLESMNSALLHRGPNSGGSIMKDGAGLAMRRLAIIDVEGSQQPIANEDNSLWLVFNGEIYNYRELRNQLQNNGHTFTTSGDAECVLHLFEDHGVECLKFLTGQFAFAIWDDRTTSLFLARDRFGEKPLFYCNHAGVLYFSSELTSLSKALPKQLSINLQSIDDYLGLQYIPEPNTIFEEVFKLPAGHYLRFRNQQVQVERYWDLQYEPKLTGSEDELAEELLDHLRNAVKQCLVSDVPLGAHLSGGIDSSIIVALMSELGSGPVKTFSAGFHEQSYSELEYARMVAKRYSTDHHEFILEYGDVPATLSKVIQHVGEPMADSSMLPLFHLCRLTKDHVTVALNGDGGDEQFAGYMRHWLDPWADRYLRVPKAARNVMLAAIKPLRDNADKPIGGSLVNGLKRLEQLGEVDKRASILRWGSYYSPRQRSALWRDDVKAHLNHNAAEQLIVDLYEAAPGKQSLDRTLYTDIRTYLTGALLVKSDRMAMANSLEGRSPFLNHNLADWAARLPVNMKVRGRTGKYLLRKAFAAYLPEPIKGRPKRGFGVPVGAWLRKPLASWSRELLLSRNGGVTEWFKPSELEHLLKEHQSGKADHGRRIWALITLALWLEQNESRLHG